MNHSEISSLKNRAKDKVRTMVRNWTKNDIEMKKTMLTISDALIRGIIDKDMVDLVFRDRLIRHIESNRVLGENVLHTAVFFELLQEVFIEEIRAMQN